MRDLVTTLSTHLRRCLAIIATIAAVSTGAGAAEPTVTTSLKEEISAGHEQVLVLRAVGSFKACFGAIARGKPFDMHATGTVAGIAWRGRGACTPMEAQPPEKAVAAFNCNLSLSDLPAEYAGGWLTSSTVAPVLGASVPPDAHVRGYMSTSIVTLRIWKQR